MPLFPTSTRYAAPLYFCRQDYEGETVVATLRKGSKAADAGLGNASGYEISADRCGRRARPEQGQMQPRRSQP